MALVYPVPGRRAGGEGNAMGDSVLVMTLNRPRSRNAIERSVAAGLLDAYDLLEQSDELRVGVLTGPAGCSAPVLT
jgi:enoyl-CoA hydratase/carnithine racemase